MGVKKENCIAFKLNYCDGGANPDCIGFRGLCSHVVMDYNVNTAKRGWCVHKNNFCKNDWCNDEELYREKLEDKWLHGDAGFCNESITLLDWYAEAGQRGNPQRPFKMDAKRDLKNHLCVLTTVPRSIKESNLKISDHDARRVFAMFIIKEDFKGDEKKPGKVSADDYWRLEFRPKEVEQMIFKNAYTKIWRQGLFRYFDDSIALKFLEMAVDVKRDTPEEDFAKEFLKQYPYK